MIITIKHSLKNNSTWYVEENENYQIKNDSVFNHLFGRYHWLKKPHKPSKTNPSSYPQDNVSLYCFFGRIYRIVDNNIDKIKQI